MRACAVVGLVVATIAGCGSPEEFGSDSTWTVVVYGHGDHNLSPGLARDLDEMKAATLRDNVNVLVLADWNGSESGFASGGEWLRIANDSIHVARDARRQPRVEAGGVSDHVGRI